MSIASSISSALSGLYANSRSSEIISSNLANALNENYARQELHTSSRGDLFSAGVHVDGVERFVDRALKATWRDAIARKENAAIELSGLESITRAFGGVDDNYSLSGYFSTLKTTLYDLESNPSSAANLGSVVNATSDLTAKFQSISTEIQSARADVDKMIDVSIENLNSDVQIVSDLNSRIVEATVLKRNTSSLLDARQEAIDRIADLVPLREIDASNGSVLLMSKGGVILVDASAANFEFDRTPTITHDMSVDSGALSLLTVNSIEVDPGKPGSQFEGGKMSALFDLRDVYLPGIQSSLDSVAYEFALSLDEVLDGTRLPGQAGLITDGGSPLDPAEVDGFSRRLSLNALVDPKVGGDARLLRDGLNSVATNDTGSSQIVSQMIEKLSEVRTSGTEQGDIADFITGVMTKHGAHVYRVESTVVETSSHFEALNEQLLADGVDTDVELQKLLEVQRNYTANAKVLQTVDEMLSRLLEVV